MAAQSEFVELQVEARKRSHAVCIRDALAGSELSRTPEGWVVGIDVDHMALAGALKSLQTCLDGNAIQVVTISVDESRYLMEARRT